MLLAGPRTHVLQFRDDIRPLVQDGFGRSGFDDESEDVVILAPMNANTFRQIR